MVRFQNIHRHYGIKQMPNIEVMKNVVEEKNKDERLSKCGLQ